MRQKKTQKILAFFILSLFMIDTPVLAVDTLWESFSVQTSTWKGSSNSYISVDENLEYYNLWDNSTVIGNYFTGSYYDDIFGHFQVDWSNNTWENVKIVSSTTACTIGYGYKLWWYSYSEYYGFIDFDFDNNTFVYYCLDDGQLHGYGYSEELWFQNFEGIVFDIYADVENQSESPTENDNFSNDGTSITDPESLPWGTDNSHFTPDTIQNNIIDFETTEESLFYIIK